MAVFLFVTTWLLLATSMEVSGRGDVVVANVQTNLSSDPLVASADASPSSNSTDTAGQNSNLTTAEREMAASGNQSVAGLATESTSSPNGAQETPGTSEVSGKPIVNVPNPIGVGPVDASNSTSGAPADEIVSTIIQQPAGREPQPPAKNATEKPAAGTNEVMKPAETSAATVVKGPPINEINESIKTTSVKSVSISLPTSTTVRPTTTTSVVSGPTASGNAASTSENNPSSSTNGSAIAERNQNGNASETASEAGSPEPENKAASTGSTNAAIAEPSEGTNNSTTPSGGEGTNRTTQSTTKETATSGNTAAKPGDIAVASEGSSKTNGSQKSGNTAVEATNENKTNVAEAGTPDSSNATTGSNTSPAQTIPSSPGSEPSEIQTIPSDSGSGNATVQTIPERSGDSNSNLSEPNGTVQTIPASSKNSSTIQTIPTPPKEPLTNPTTIVGDPTFVGISETSENGTGGINGTMVDLGNSTISNATTLVPPLVPTKSELLKRRIEKDTVSIRKNLEKRAAYYKRTEARMTSLLQTIKKRNQLTQTALKHLPELLSALITEPTQRIKLSQLFAAANALQAITSEVGVEAASNVTTVVSPSEAVRVSNATAI